ncbi:MAG: cyclic nucleotide-binding domain-containing protein [Desulfobulbaceae bacterium]|nr:cyclic nucleotide-binding domain-containing protein [Desulfobulbaceae bacterium]
MEIHNHPDLQRYSQTCPAGTVLLNEGEQASSLYILIAGRLEVIKGGKKINEISEPGALFGELAFLLGTVRSASVIAATAETRFLCLPNLEAERIWREIPEFAWELARTIARRLHETTSVAQGFREFCDQMPDAVIMLDALHRVLSWNRAAELLYGRTWDQMRGQTIETIYDNQASFQQFMAVLENSNFINEKILKIDHPSKSWIFVSTSTRVLRDPDGHIQGYLFVGRDATSQQTLEKKHRQTKQRLLPGLLALAVALGWLLHWGLDLLLGR